MLWCNNSTWMLCYGLLFSCVVVEEKVDDPVCSSKTGKKSKKFSGKGPIIVEMHNVAEFLSVVNNDILGKDGTKNLQGLRFEEDVISSKSGYIDNTLKTKNINHVLSAEIGERGEPITIDDVIAMLQYELPNVPERENEYYPYFIDLLKAVEHFVGKEGPCYLEHGIVTSSNKDAKLDFMRRSTGQMLVEPGQLGFGQEDTSGEMSIMPIGEKGKKVTLNDIIDTFRKVSTHERLEKFRHSGRKVRVCFVRCLLWRVQYENSAIRILI